MGTGALSSRSFAIQNWSRSNRRSHRRTRWASGASCLQSKASTTLSLACAPTAPNSSARWPSTRTSTDSATCEALRASSSRWPRNSSEAFAAVRDRGDGFGRAGICQFPWFRRDGNSYKPVPSLTSVGPPLRARQCASQQYLPRPREQLAQALGDGAVAPAVLVDRRGTGELVLDHCFHLRRRLG